MSSENNNQPTINPAPLLDSNQSDIQNVIDIYRMGYQIARAQTENEVYQKIQDISRRHPNCPFTWRRLEKIFGSR